MENECGGLVERNRIRSLSIRVLVVYTRIMHLDENYLNDRDRAGENNISTVHPVCGDGGWGERRMGNGKYHNCNRNICLILEMCRGVGRCGDDVCGRGGKCNSPLDVDKVVVALQNENVYIWQRGGGCTECTSGSSAPHSWRVIWLPATLLPHHFAVFRSQLPTTIISSAHRWPSTHIIWPSSRSWRIEWVTQYAAPLAHTPRNENGPETNKLCEILCVCVILV